MKSVIVLASLTALLGLLRPPLHASPPAGRVVGWGINISGEATGVPTESSPAHANSATGAVTITDQALSNVVAISAGQSHSLALTSDGTVQGWGNNASGETIGYRTEYPFRTNGLVEIGGRALSNVALISAGEHLSMALMSNGHIVTWGEGPAETWGSWSAPSGFSNVVAIAAGIRECLALKKDGTVAEWGVGGGERRTPSGMSNIVAIATGGFSRARHLAVNRDGTVVAWGIGGKETVPAEVTNIVSVSAGEAHNLALTKDGLVVGWGSNRFGEATGVPTTDSPDSSSGMVVLGGRVLSGVAAIAAGHEFSLALKRDGTVVAWGSNQSHVTDVPAGLSGVVAIAAGGHFCLAITTNSGAWPAHR